jgi:hypothetical protein
MAINLRNKTDAATIVLVVGRVESFLRVKSVVDQYTVLFSDSYKHPAPIHPLFAASAH